MKHLTAIVLLVVLGLGIYSVILDMPTFGNPENPGNKISQQEIVNKAVEETGSQNVVSSIITDYRAFDTLLETTVLFAAIAGIFATLINNNNRDSGDVNNEI
ncbi:MAG: hydrogen gas-evolving membrane-bound hydrogenase subunit E [Bacillota bacterium]